MRLLLACDNVFLSYENPDNHRLLNQLGLIEMIVEIDNCVPFWEYLLLLANF